MKFKFVLFCQPCSDHTTRHHCCSCTGYRRCDAFAFQLLIIVIKKHISGFSVEGKLTLLSSSSSMHLKLKMKSKTLLIMMKFNRCTLPDLTDTKKANKHVFFSFLYIQYIKCSSSYYSFISMISYNNTFLTCIKHITVNDE